MAVLLRCSGNLAVDACHDTLKLGIYFLKGPGQTLGVLAHLQCGNSYAAGICCLCRHIQEAALNAGLLVCINGICVRRHVRTLAYAPAAIGDQSLCFLAIDFVLGCARKSDIALHAPRLLALEILSGRNLFDIFLDSSAMALLDIEDNVKLDSIGIVNISVGVGAGNRLCTELLSLLDCILCNVSGSGNNDGLAFQRLSCALYHLVGDVNKAVAGCFRSCKRAAEAKALTGQNTLVQIGDSLILTIQIADFTSADTDITCGNILVCTDILKELCHEALAEAHYLAIRLALGIEIGAALAAADRKTGQGVLEDLLEAEELQNGLVNGGMETKTSLVRSDCRIELYTVAEIDLLLPLIIDPRNAEGDDALGLNQTLQKGILAINLLICFYDRSDGLQNSLCSFQKFRLVCVLRLQLRIHFFNI